MKVSVKKNPKYVVELSAYEAYVLLAITGNIGGRPRGPRGVTDELGEQLREALADTDVYAFRVSGSLHIEK